MSLRDIRRRRDEDAVRQYCVERLGVDPAAHGATIFRGRTGSSYGWTDHDGKPAEIEECNLMWLKSRLRSEGVPLPGFDPNREDDPADAFGPELHCFFLSLDETPEMLRLLRRHKTERLLMFLLARSRLPRSLYYVRPIDATAGRVLECERQEVA